MSKKIEIEIPDLPNDMELKRWVIRTLGFLAAQLPDHLQESFHQAMLATSQQVREPLRSLFLDELAAGFEDARLQSAPHITLSDLPNPERL